MTFSVEVEPKMLSGARSLNIFSAVEDNIKCALLTVLSGYVPSRFHIPLGTI